EETPPALGSSAGVGHPPSAIANMCILAGITPRFSGANTRRAADREGPRLLPPFARVLMGWHIAYGPRFLQAVPHVCAMGGVIVAVTRTTIPWAWARTG